MKIGVCGKSGTGKTTLAKYLVSKNYIHINLDEEAKKMYQNPEVKVLLITQFGEEVYIDGKINRDYLSSLVFSNRDNLNKINQIFYPRLFQLVKMISEKSSDIIVDGAILFDAGIDRIMDKTIYMKSDTDTMLKRIYQREKRDKAILIQRIEAQSFLDKCESKADFTIITDSSKENLYKKIDEIIC